MNDNYSRPMQAGLEAVRKRDTPNPMPGQMLQDALRECDFLYCGDTSIEVGIARLRDAIYWAGYDLMPHVEG